MKLLVSENKLKTMLYISVRIRELIETVSCEK